MPGQATVEAYADATTALRSDLGAIEDRVFHVCDAMNAALMLARPRNTYDACATFRARVDAARTAGAQAALQLDANCSVDSAAGDQCASMCPAESCSSTDCTESMPCHDACNTVAIAGVACTVATTLVSSNLDDDLASAITANASEWGTLESLIAQIQSMEPTDDLFDAKVKVLSEMIDHHVEEEETEMFPKVRKTKLDLEELGAEMAARKEAIELPPH